MSTAARRGTQRQQRHTVRYLIHPDDGDVLAFRCPPRLGKDLAVDLRGSWAWGKASVILPSGPLPAAVTTCAQVTSTPSPAKKPAPATSPPTLRT